MPYSYHHRDSCLPLHFSSFFPSYFRQHLFFLYLVISHNKCNLAFSYISCGTTFQELTFCYTFKATPCYAFRGLFISLRPLSQWASTLSLVSFFLNNEHNILVVCCSAQIRCAFFPRNLQVHLDAARTFLSDFRLEHSSMNKFPIWQALASVVLQD